MLKSVETCIEGVHGNTWWHEDTKTGTWIHLRKDLPECIITKEKPRENEEYMGLLHRVLNADEYVDFQLEQLSKVITNCFI